MTYFYLCTICCDVALIAKVAMSGCPLCGCPLSEQSDLRSMVDRFEKRFELEVWSARSNGLGTGDHGVDGQAGNGRK